jgi:hypothetical protein
MCLQRILSWPLACQRGVRHLPLLNVAYYLQLEIILLNVQSNIHGFLDLLNHL